MGLAADSYPPTHKFLQTRLIHLWPDKEVKIMLTFDLWQKKVQMKNKPSGNDIFTNKVNE